MFAFSGILSFLATIAPLLEDRFGLPTVEASLLIGALPLTIIATNAGLAALIGRRRRRGERPPPPFYIVRVALCVLLLAAACHLTIALGPRTPLRTAWPYLLGALFVEVFGVAMGARGPRGEINHVGSRRPDDPRGAPAAGPRRAPRRRRSGSRDV